MIIWEKAISILVGNLNSGHIYLITAVSQVESDQNTEWTRHYCNWLTLVLSLGFPYQEKATFTKSFSSRYIYADPSWFFVLGFGYSQQLFKISWRWRLLILVVNHWLFLIHLLHFSKQFKRTVAFCRM